MSFCSNCGAKLEENSKFCTVCGTAVAPVAEPQAQPVVEEVPVAPAAPVYSAPVEPVYVPASTPVYEPAPVPSNVKVQGFVGMGLAIGGLFFAALGVLYVLIGMVEEGLGFGFSIGFGIFSWPLSIVGKILSGKSKDAGNPSNVCSIGAKLGLAGIIVSAVMMFFGFINLFV